LQPVQSISEIVLGSIRKAMQNSLRVTLKNDWEQLHARSGIRETIGVLFTCIHVACISVNGAVGAGDEKAVDIAGITAIG
jgi:hypothetical protein